MRQLRKTNMEYEERNAALQKHVESMRGAVERLEGDVVQERGRNGLLQQHLDTLRQALASSFSSIPLPCKCTSTHTHHHHHHVFNFNVLHDAKLNNGPCCPVLLPPAASGETPTLDTIDSYMKKLHSIIVSSPQEHESLINTVRDVVTRLDR